MCLQQIPSKTFEVTTVKDENFCPSCVSPQSCPMPPICPLRYPRPSFYFTLSIFPLSLPSLSLSLCPSQISPWLAAHRVPFAPFFIPAPPPPASLSRRPPPKAHLPRAGSHCISNLAQPPGTCCTDCTVLLFRLSNVTGRRRSPPSQLTEHRGAPLGH